MRRRSSALFGNRCLAEVVVAIVDLTSVAGDRLITVRMVAAHTGLTDSLVRPVVKRLVVAGLLAPQPQNRLRGARYHEVCPEDGVWDTLVRTCQLLHDRTSVA